MLRLKKAGPCKGGQGAADRVRIASTEKINALRKTRDAKSKCPTDRPYIGEKMAPCNYISSCRVAFVAHLPQSTASLGEEHCTEIKVTKPRSVHSPQKSAQESRASGQPAA